MHTLISTLTLLTGTASLAQAAASNPFIQLGLEPRTGGEPFVNSPAAAVDHQRRQDDGGEQSTTVMVTSITIVTESASGFPVPTSRTSWSAHMGYSESLASLSQQITTCSSLLSSFRAASPTPNAVLSSYLSSSGRSVLSSLRSVRENTSTSRPFNDIRTADFSSLCSAESAYLTTNSLPNAAVATAWTSYVQAWQSWKSQDKVQSDGRAIVSRCTRAGVIQGGNLLRQIATDVEECVSAWKVSLGLDRETGTGTETVTVSRTRATQTTGMGTVTTGESEETGGAGNGNGGGSQGQVSTTGTSTAGATRETAYVNVAAAAAAAAAVGIAGVMA